jgi:ATP-dependent helicase HepA
MRDLRDGQGARALLSSRIDLRPHQAFVAARVLLDRQRRYLLADEVGLGKTIEAGIVIHDLLRRKPAANILVLCPGSLTHQWLCEMYSKFCGRVFRMPELRGGRAPAKLDGQIILSFSGALGLRQVLLKTSWDLVVLDEAHHLLGAPHLYEFARDISKGTEGLLLLSAVPAQRRQDEYLKLLALLEPDRYKLGSDRAMKEFEELYDLQIEIGQKLRYIVRRLEDIAEDNAAQPKALAKAAELAELSVLKGDPKIQTAIENLRVAADGTFNGLMREFLHYVGDTYRINRRILRNRRARLIAAEEIPAIKRQFTRLAYSPDQPELDAYAAVVSILRDLKESKRAEDAVLALGRQLLQSLCAPTSLERVVELAAVGAAATASERELFVLDSIVGYDEQEAQTRALWGICKPPKDALARLLRAAKAWRDSVAESDSRQDVLVKYLKSRHQSAAADKIIVFAGFQGLAEDLAQKLGKIFGRESVAAFHHRMSTPEKEDEARRFKTNSNCWLLVSDETGGEGRNFQFAAELIHYDLPWHVSKIEQRIGRLDRLGRARGDVNSVVIVPEGTESDALLDCLAAGFEVFTGSISGLEFALRGLERQMILSAIEGEDILRALTPKVKAAAEEERAQDDAQEVLDAASNGNGAGFRQLRSSPEREKVLEQAFGRYFRSMSDNDSVWWLRDADGRPGAVRFRPASLKGLTLALPQDPHGDTPEFTGTFFRSLAQERPDLAFFSVGNAFCDAFLETLSRSVNGRAYAIEVQPPGDLSWRGFELSYRIVGSTSILGDNGGLLNQLDRIFALPLVRVFIADDGTVPVAETGAALLSLRRKLDRHDCGRTWFDLSDDDESRLEQQYEGWIDLVQTAEKAAQVIAVKQAKESLAPLIAAETTRIGEQIRQAKRLKLSGWKEEIEGLDLFMRAVGDWKLELDSVGFLSVNGGIAS